MKKILALIIAVFLIGTVFTGCNGTKKATDNGKLNIVATIFPEYDFARAIAGDKANISMLTKPGASVHSFDPSPADIQKVQNADVFIYIGGESDAWVDGILDSIDTSKMKVIRLMDHINTVEEEIKEGMEEEESGEHEEEEQEYDEHIWTSPKNARRRRPLSLRVVNIARFARAKTPLPKCTICATIASNGSFAALGKPYRFSESSLDLCQVSVKRVVAALGKPYRFSESSLDLCRYSVKRVVCRIGKTVPVFRIEP